MSRYNYIHNVTTIATIFMFNMPLYKARSDTERSYPTIWQKNKVAITIAVGAKGSTCIHGTRISMKDTKPMKQDRLNDLL